jgi:FG-GAP-like repeat/FG-GAP repeat
MMGTKSVSDRRSHASNEPVDRASELSLCSPVDPGFRISGQKATTAAMTRMVAGVRGRARLRSLSVTLGALACMAGPASSAGLEKQVTVEPDGVYCDEVEGAQFGRTLALAKLDSDNFDDLVVSSGKGVWVYHSFGNGLFDFPVQLSSQTGGSVNKADVNNDGFDDVIVSYSSASIDAFYGSAGGFSFGATPDWSYFEAGNFGGTGPSLVDAIDVNADGTDDIIVGAPSMDKAHVFYGSVTGLPADLTPDTTIEGGPGSQEGINYIVSGGLGTSVAKDGKLCSPPSCTGTQFVIGVPGADIDLDDSGTYTANEQELGVALVGPRYQFLSGDQVRSSFGYELGHAGDLNGDGETDLIISAKGTPSIDPKVFVYLGQDEYTKMNLDYAWAVEETDTARSPGTFGQAVGSGGDINADGYPDIVIGDPRFDVVGGRSQTDIGFWGRVYVWFGGPPGPGDPTGLGPSPIPSTADIKLNASGLSANFGASFAPGDINGDGVGDLVVGDIRGARGCEDYDTGIFQVVETGLVGIYLPEPDMALLCTTGVMMLALLSTRRTAKGDASNTFHNRH